MAAFPLDALHLADIMVSGRGAKSCPFTANGKPVTQVFGPMRVAFEPSAYGDQDASRVNICWRIPDDATMDAFEGLDRWVLETVSKDPVKYFGKHKTADQIQDSYCSCVKRSEKYTPQIRAKLNLSGSYPVKVWDADGKPRPHPETWKDALVKPKLQLKNLYFMGQGAFGCTLECTDVQLVEEATQQCPF